MRNNIEIRLAVLEQEAKNLFKPSHEENVCAYLRLVFSDNRDPADLKERYERVQKTVPKMH
jgi:hypothetical protein